MATEAMPAQGPVDVNVRPQKSAFEHWYTKHWPALDSDCFESEMRVAISAWNASRIDIMLDIYHELAELRWEVVDAGWNLAIEAVRDRLFELGTMHGGVESCRPILTDPSNMLPNADVTGLAPAQEKTK